MSQNVSRQSALRSNLIGDRAFYRETIAIVVPIIIQNTVTNIVSLLDNVMVGQVGTLEMSAVAIVNQLLFIFNLCIFGGFSGAGIFATQFAGARDDAGVRYCFRVKLLLGVGLMAAALGVFLGMPRELISMYLAEGTSAADAAATMGFGLEYLQVMLVGLLPFAVSQAYASTLRELGETRLPMVASIVAILVNLVFNYLLIFGALGFPRLGVVGAAAATVLSRFVEMFIIMFFTHRHGSRFPFIQGAYRSLYVPGTLAASMVRRGAPLLINEFLWSAGMATLMQCYSVRGLDVVAGMNISSTVANLFNVVFLSMGNAVAIMVGQALGAGEVDRAKQTAWRLITFGISTCFVMGTLMFLCAPLVPYLYNTGEHVREMASSFLRVVAVMTPFMSFSHCCYFTIRSGGRTIITFLFDSMYTWCVAVPVAFVLANFTQLPIVPLYLAVQSLELIKCVVGFVMVRKGVWVRNIVSGTLSPEK